MAIHPNQVAVINEVFTPTAEEIAVSEEIVEGVRRQPGGRRRSPSAGQMVDRAHIARAERILARAKAAVG